MTRRPEMSRTKAQAVEDVLSAGGDYDAVGKPNLAPFIDAANAIVSRVATCATSKGVTLSTSELELIERWYAAHCYATSDRPYANRSTSGAGGSFQGQTGKYTEATFYGQMAMSLDFSGCLKAITMGQRAGAVWLGKPKSEQIDYGDRD
jgi:hypothetical protein